MIIIVLKFKVIMFLTVEKIVGQIPLSLATRIRTYLYSDLQSYLFIFFLFVLQF